METIIIDNDITVMCVQAKSFPAGILEAHKTLHALVPPGNGRRYFGLSRPEGSMTNIVYKAAAEQMAEGEAFALALDTITIRSGNYLSIDIPDFHKDVTAIGNAFQQMLQQPGVDPQGYCVELYLDDKNVQCMVRLAG